MRVTLVSLDPWDEVWRRNQHFAANLLRDSRVQQVDYVSPPTRSGEPATEPLPGLTVLTPALRIPKRLGGLRDVARQVRRTTKGADVLWVNDPVIGRLVRRRSQPTVYDVTDDWREADLLDRERRRLVAAETSLARSAVTVVCSQVLADRWAERYGVTATVVRNGVDLSATGGDGPGDLGDGPHLGYVGTLHPERLDVELVCRVARAGLGTVHLVGPDSLDDASREVLRGSGVRLHGPVAAADVPGWLRALTVLLSPHRVTPFTLSLDAIKSSEYLASGRPVVSTPTSGFQSLTAPGLHVVGAGQFLPAIVAALAGGSEFGLRGAVGWDERARDFGHVLRAAAGGPR